MIININDKVLITEKLNYHIKQNKWYGEVCNIINKEYNVIVTINEPPSYMIRHDGIEYIIPADSVKKVL